MKKISVVMPSYLEYYPNRATKPEMKFIRAVKSFLSQTYENKQLIIIADGCIKTKQIYEEHFSKYENIKFFMLPKQELYSGNVRNKGLELADGDIISYLDNDDIIAKTHLTNIVKGFENNDVDFVYYNDYLVTEPTFKTLYMRENELRYSQCGTSSISHLNIKSDWLKWTGLYGHDYVFIMTMILNGLKFKKISGCSYLVCHYGNISQGGGNF
jgi:glycosyltransferase involved in cell wall biosynthesis